MRESRVRMVVPLLAVALLVAAAAPELTAQPRTPVKIAVLRAAFVQVGRAHRLI